MKNFVNEIVQYLSCAHDMDLSMYQPSFLENSVKKRMRDTPDIISHLIPDAMLLDQMLPCINGFEFLTTIRASWQAAHIPELKLTASALTSDKESILNYGFDGFFPKLIDEPKFLTMINEILYGKQEN